MHLDKQDIIEFGIKESLNFIKDYANPNPAHDPEKFGRWYTKALHKGQTLVTALGLQQKWVDNPHPQERGNLPNRALNIESLKENFRIQLFEVYLKEISLISCLL